MLSFRSGILLFFGSLAFVGILALTVGIYFDGGSDVYTYHVVRGNFTSVPLPYFSSFGFYPFSSNIIAELYKHNHQIPWFDIVVYLNITIVCFLLLLLWRIKGFSPLLFIIFLIPWFDNILLPELTKLGFWMAFLSLLIYYSSQKEQKLAKVLCIILFTYSFMIRAEPAFLATICFYLYLVISTIAINRPKISSIHIRFLPFIAVAIIFSVLLNINFTDQDKLYRSFRPYQFTLWDFKQDPSGVKLMNGTDSVILMAAQNHFVSDISKINKLFFDRIGLHPKDKTLASIPGYFENFGFLKTKVALELGRSGYYLPAVLTFSIFVFICLALPFRNDRRKLLSLVGVFCICLLLLCFLCIFMKLERHVALPLLMSCSLFMICLTSSPGYLRMWQICLMALGSVFLIYSIHAHYSFERLESKNASILCGDVNKRFPEALTYIDLYTMVTLHRNLFSKDDFPYDRALSFDNAIISYYPEWAEKMTRSNQPVNMASLGNKFIHDSPKTIFIFNKGREQIFEKYFYSVYGKRVLFEEIRSPFSAGAGYPYSYFRILNQGS